MKESEIMALPSKSRKEVESTDKPLGATEGHTPLGFGRDPLTDHIFWYSAYERPSTGERFKVYESDGP